MEIEYSRGVKIMGIVSISQRYVLCLLKSMGRGNIKIFGAAWVLLKIRRQPVLVTQSPVKDRDINGGILI